MNSASAFCPCNHTQHRHAISGAFKITCPLNIKAGPRYNEVNLWYQDEHQTLDIHEESTVKLLDRLVDTGKLPRNFRIVCLEEGEESTCYRFMQHVNRRVFKGHRKENEAEEKQERIAAAAAGAERTKRSNERFAAANPTIVATMKRRAAAMEAAQDKRLAEVMAADAMKQQVLRDARVLIEAGIQIDTALKMKAAADFYEQREAEQLAFDEAEEEREEQESFYRIRFGTWVDDERKRRWGFKAQQRTAAATQAARDRAAVAAEQAAVPQRNAFQDLSDALGNQIRRAAHLRHAAANRPLLSVFLGFLKPVRLPESCVVCTNDDEVLWSLPCGHSACYECWNNMRDSFTRCCQCREVYKEGQLATHDDVHAFFNKSMQLFLKGCKLAKVQATRHEGKQKIYQGMYNVYTAARICKNHLQRHHLRQMLAHHCEAVGARDLIGLIGTVENRRAEE